MTGLTVMSTTEIAVLVVLVVAVRWDCLSSIFTTSMTTAAAAASAHALIRLLTFLLWGCFRA